MALEGIRGKFNDIRANMEISSAKRELYHTSHRIGQVFNEVGIQVNNVRTINERLLGENSPVNRVEAAYHLKRIILGPNIRNGYWINDSINWMRDNLPLLEGERIEPFSEKNCRLQASGNQKDFFNLTGAYRGRGTVIQRVDLNIEGDVTRYEYTIPVEIETFSGQDNRELGFKNWPSYEKFPSSIKGKGKKRSVRRHIETMIRGNIYLTEENNRKVEYSATKDKEFDIKTSDTKRVLIELKGDDYLMTTITREPGEPVTKETRKVMKLDAESAERVKPLLAGDHEEIRERLKKTEFTDGLTGDTVRTIVVESGEGMYKNTTTYQDNGREIKIVDQNNNKKISVNGAEVGEISYSSYSNLTRIIVGDTTFQCLSLDIDGNTAYSIKRGNAPLLKNQIQRKSWALLSEDTNLHTVIINQVINNNLQETGVDQR